MALRLDTSRQLCATHGANCAPSNREKSTWSRTVHTHGGIGCSTMETLWSRRTDFSSAITSGAASYYNKFTSIHERNVETTKCWDNNDKPVLSRYKPQESERRVTQLQSGPTTHACELSRSEDSCAWLGPCMYTTPRAKVHAEPVRMIGPNNLLPETFSHPEGLYGEQSAWEWPACGSGGAQWPLRRWRLPRFFPNRAK